MTFKYYILLFVIISFLIIIIGLEKQTKSEYKRYLKKGGVLSFKEFKKKYYTED